MPIVSCFCLKICFRLVASVLFFFISRSPFLCALSTSNIGSVSHPAGDRPSHPICETGLIGMWPKPPCHTPNLTLWHPFSVTIRLHWAHSSATLHAAHFSEFSGRCDLIEAGRPCISRL